MSSYNSNNFLSRKTRYFKCVVVNFSDEKISFNNKLPVISRKENVSDPEQYCDFRSKKQPLKSSQVQAIFCWHVQRSRKD